VQGSPEPELERSQETWVLWGLNYCVSSQPLNTMSLLSISHLSHKMV